MKRLFFAVYVLWAINLLVVGPSRTRVVVVICALLLAAVAIAARWRSVNAAHPIAAALWSNRGPRTDVQFMSRSELFRSGRTFLAGGAILFASYIGFVVNAGPRFGDSAFSISVSAVFMLTGLVGISGGLYLFVRGFCRSASYMPVGTPSPKNAA